MYCSCGDLADFRITDRDGITVHTLCSRCAVLFLAESLAAHEGGGHPVEAIEHSEG